MIDVPRYLQGGYMSIRKVVLIVALLSPIAAVCAEDAGLDVTGDSIQFSKDSGEVQCGRCTVKLKPSQATRFQANQISLDKDTGSMYLEGGVRVSLQGGKELRAERVVVKNSNGVQELSGDDFRIIKTTSL
jgi:hypothetical protein